MRQLRVLLHKEWRDQRALVLGGGALALLVVALARVLDHSTGEQGSNTRLALPGCEWIFALALAVEVIARDAASGVETTLMRLPVSRQLAWRAKLAFVVLASAGLHLALTLGAVIARLLEGSTPLEALSDMYQPAVWLFGGLLASAAFVAACVLKRSLPAAVSGIALVVALPLLATSALEGRARDWLDILACSWTRTGASTAAVCAFLLGSFLAFRVRRSDPSGLRRAAGAALGVGVVVVPLMAGTAHAAAWAFDIVPFRASAGIEGVAPSPDGRFLAVQIRQSWTPRENWSGCGQDTRNRREVWIYDRVGRKWAWLDERCREFRPGAAVWDQDGLLHTRSFESAFTLGAWVDELVDPATGTTRAGTGGTLVPPVRDPRLHFEAQRIVITSGDGRERETIYEVKP